MNTVEMGAIKFIIARMKSKSPNGYAMLTKVCAVLAALMAAYIGLYNEGIFPAATHLFGQIDNICIVAGAIMTTAGVVASTTTTDPTLISKETKDNVITHAGEPLGPQQ